MKKVTSALCALILVGFSTQAFADCTAEDLQAKATELSGMMVALAEKDPEAMTKLATEMQDAATKFQGADSMDDACEYYDELIADTKEATE